MLPSKNLPRKCHNSEQQETQTAARMRRMKASLLGQSAAIAVRHALLRRTRVLTTLTEGTMAVFASTSSPSSYVLLSTPSPGSHHRAWTLNPIQVRRMSLANFGSHTATSRTENGHCDEVSEVNQRLTDRCWHVLMLGRKPTERRVYPNSPNVELYIEP